MQFDIVWFTPARRLEAYALVKPLSPQELAGRDQPHPWRLATPAPIPDVGGRKVAEGAAIVRNFLGSLGLSFGAVEDGRLWLSRFVHVTPVAEGLAGGTIMPEFWGVAGVRALADDQRHQEAAAASLRPVPASAHLRVALLCLLAVPASLYAAVRALPVSWALWRARRRGSPDPYLAAVALMSRAVRNPRAARG